MRKLVEGLLLGFALGAMIVAQSHRDTISGQRVCEAICAGPAAVDQHDLCVCIDGHP